jgi:hypothetical protein
MLEDVIPAGLLAGQIDETDGRSEAARCQCLTVRSIGQRQERAEPCQGDIPVPGALGVHRP